MSHLEDIGLVMVIILVLLSITLAVGLVCGMIYNDWLKPLFLWAFKKGKQMRKEFNRWNKKKRAGYLLLK